MKSEIRFKPGQVATVKTVGASTLERSEKSLTLREKRAIKVKKLKEHIRNHPVGTAFTNRELAKVLDYSSDVGIINMRGQEWFQREFLAHKAEGKWGYIYTVREDVKSRIGTPTYVPPPTAKVYTQAMINEKAKEFAWQEDSDSLRQFIKWLIKEEKGEENNESDS